MELKDLIGRHKLSGVDYVPSTREKISKLEDYGNDILFCLDGITYLITEDEDDGYRSFMTELDITDRTIRNVFPAQEVECIYVDEVDKETADMIQMKSLDGKLILEFGTEMINDYYPYTVFAYYPENMDINN